MGPIETVDAFVEARVAAGGPAGRHIETERIFRLTAVRPPRPAPGTRRVATRATTATSSPAGSTRS